MRHSGEIIRQGLADEIGRCMLGFADMQADGRERLIRRDSFEQLVELLEGIRLQAVEIGIQFICRVGQAAGVGQYLPGLSLLIEAEL